MTTPNVKDLTLILVDDFGDWIDGDYAIDFDRQEADEAPIQHHVNGDEGAVYVRLETGQTFKIAVSEVA